MNDIFKKVTTNLKYAAGKTSLWLRRHDTDIAMVFGIGGVITGTVMACIATSKLPDTMEKTKERIDEIKENTEGEEQTKALTVAYGGYAMDMVKLYGPATVTTTASIAAMLWAHNAMKRRTIALASAYITISQSYKEYRQRVVDRYGEDTDYELHTGICKAKSTEVVTDSEGNVASVDKSIDILPDKNVSGYARIFDRTNPHWDEYIDANRMFLGSRENYFTAILGARKYLWLNEVYRELGFPETLAGTEVGWVVDTSEGSVSDNVVRLHVREIEVPSDFDPDQYEKAFIIDPNVDGPIKTRVPLEAL